MNQITRTLTAKNVSLGQRVGAALSDLREGLECWHMWAGLGWRDVRVRYDRSVLGPLWLTISMGVWTLAIGILYSELLHSDIQSYLPYLAAGIIIWTFITSIIIDSSKVFIEANALITEIPLPFSVYIYRMLWKNLIIAAHNLLVLAIVFIYFQVPVRATALFSLLGLLFVIVNGVTAGMLLGLVSARFRDLPPVFDSIIRVLFFLTPIMWEPKLLAGKKQLLLTFNPFHYFLKVLRDPLLGNTPALHDWIVMVSITVAGWVIALVLFGRYKDRIAYWV
jgi:lipopolysaccharide transport system permease protein